MKKLLAAGAVAGLVFLGAGIGPASAVPAEGQICGPGDSGKIEVAEGVNTLTIEAPEGKEIVAVCLKAGSVKNGGGIEIIEFDPGQVSVTVSHFTTKDISHYSVRYGEPCVYGDDCENDDDWDYDSGNS